MIADFPVAYEGESFYSVCARFMHHRGLDNTIACALELFGTNYMPGFDLPRCLDEFTAKLVPGHPLTSENIIRKHSAFPYITSFLPRDRGDLIGTAMRTNGTTRLRSALVPAQWCKNWPSVLRLCPECVVQDRERYSECYWHLVHQMPGVHVCALHNLWLNESKVQVRGGNLRYKYVSAERAVEELIFRPLDLEARQSDYLLNLATDTVWLLDHGELLLEEHDVRLRYGDHFRSKGFVTVHGKIRARELSAAFNEHYSPTLLELLHSPLDSDKYVDSWLLRLLRSEGSMGKVVLPPVQHMLLIRFLGSSVEEFSARAREVCQPFGAGPWPCANPLCPEYSLHTIREYRLRKLQHAGELRAAFSCTVCGFEYVAEASQVGSGKVPAKFTVRVAGQLWDEELVKLAGDSRISIWKAATRLGVGYFRVRNEAYRLGVSFQRRRRRALSKSPIHRQIGGLSTAAKVGENCAAHAEVEKKRSAWLSHMERHPGIGRAKLRATARSLSNWLAEYDHVWFVDHLPAPLRNREAVSYVDWPAIDSLVAEQVHSAANELRNRPGHPMRISKLALARSSRHHYYIRYQLSKLPKTMKALDDVTENQAEFAVRRVMWTAENLREKG